MSVSVIFKCSYFRRGRERTHSTNADLISLTRNSALKKILADSRGAGGGGEEGGAVLQCQKSTWQPQGSLTVFAATNICICTGVDFKL